MNLHQIVSGAIGAVNPHITVSIRVSTGYTTAADGVRTGTYDDPVDVVAQIQPLTGRDLRQLEGLNLQGELKAIYIDGEVNGAVRVAIKGGDLVTLPDGTVWLIVQSLENFNLSAGWSKSAMVLQND